MMVLCISWELIDSMSGLTLQWMSAFTSALWVLWKPIVYTSLDSFHKVPYFSRASRPVSENIPRRGGFKRILWVSKDSMSANWITRCGWARWITRDLPTMGFMKDCVPLSWHHVPLSSSPPWFRSSNTSMHMYMTMYHQTLLGDLTWTLLESFELPKYVVTKLIKLFLVFILIVLALHNVVP